MYERLLDKEHQPTEEAFAQHCGSARALLEQLDAFLTSELGAQRLMRFPYGKRYGWGYKYFIGKAHLCDVFAEKDAFNVMLRLSDRQYETLYASMTPETQACIDDRYPCGNGGWIHHRILQEAQLQDVMQLLRLKVK